VEATLERDAGSIERATEAKRSINVHPAFRQRRDLCSLL
jgi:hypothetical protein